MNRDIKIAILIAPVLIIGGYIAADYYDEEQNKNRNLFQLELKGQCDLTKSPCSLSHNQLLLSLSDNNGITQIDSSHALEQVAFSLLDENNQEVSYTMKPGLKYQHWQAKTPVSKLIKTLPEVKIRIVSTINNGFYFSEFFSRKQ